jgi:hypothetical protein
MYKSCEINVQNGGRCAGDGDEGKGRTRTRRAAAAAAWPEKDSAFRLSGRSDAMTEMQLGHACREHVRD